MKNVNLPQLLSAVSTLGALLYAFRFPHMIQAHWATAFPWVIWFISSAAIYLSCLITINQDKE